MNETVTLSVPVAGVREVTIDGVSYPVTTTGTTTVPRRHLATMLNNGYEDVEGNVAGAWEDLIGDISQGAGTAALAYEAYRDTSYLMYFMQHNQADALHFRYQMPHAWDPATAVRPHMHFVPMVNPAAPQVFGIKGQYAWADFGQVVPADSGWTAFAAVDTIAVDDAFKHKILSFGTWAPPVTAGPSSFLLVRMYRDTGATDTYTTSKAGAGTAQANIGLLGADLHWQKKWQGTPSEYA